MFNKKKIKELEDKIEVLEKWRDDILDKEWREENPNGMIEKVNSGIEVMSNWIFLYYERNKKIHFYRESRNNSISNIKSEKIDNKRFFIDMTVIEEDYWNIDRTVNHLYYNPISFHKYFLVDTKTEMVYNVDSEGRLI